MGQSAGQPNDRETIWLSVVIPAYNEESRLAPTLQAVCDYACRIQHPIELIVVDDGSTDKTSEVVRCFSPGPLRVKLIRNEVNRGKGYSVSRGMQEAAGGVILMSDADMNTPFDELDKLLPWISQGYEVVIGSRAMGDSEVNPPRPVHRRLASFIFRNLRRLILLPGLKDTQCGFKLFTRESALRIVPHQTIDGYAFDCEVLAVAQKLGYRIKELGVRWTEGSVIHISLLENGPRMLRDVWRIRRRMGRMAKPEIRNMKSE